MMIPISTWGRLAIVGGAVVVASVVAFVLYGLDKAAAQRGARRVPEKTLHLWGLFGGWPGALLAQQLFRHKTRKVSFQVVFWLTVVLNCAAIGLVALLPGMESGGNASKSADGDSGSLPIIRPGGRR